MSIEEAAAILGVGVNISKREVKKAYRALALVKHPDKGGDQKEFAEINRAYGMLLNFGVASAYTQKPSESQAPKDEYEHDEFIVGSEVRIERSDGTVDFIPRGPDAFQQQRRYELDLAYQQRRRKKELKDSTL